MSDQFDYYTETPLHFLCFSVAYGFLVTVCYVISGFVVAKTENRRFLQNILLEILACIQVKYWILRYPKQHQDFCVFDLKIALKILNWEFDIFKSKERSEDSYNGLADFFFKKKSRNFDFSRFDFWFLFKFSAF